jgi:MacB-like periplasmic core domain/FtsX-like permease family
VNAGTKMRAKADARSHTTSLVVITILIALAGAVSMAAFAGARRSATAYERFREETNEPEVILIGGEGCPLGPPLDLGEIGALPEVTAWQPGWMTFANVRDLHGEALLYESQAFEATLLAIGAGGDETPRPLMLEGREPRNADEIVLGYADENARRPRVGDVISLEMVKVGHEDAILSGEFDPGDVLQRQLSVVGIGVLPGEADTQAGALWGTGVLGEQLRDDVLGCDLGAFQLRGGLADTSGFLARVKGQAPDVFFLDTATGVVVAGRASSLQTIVLRLFGGLIALAALLMLGQTLVRRTLLVSTDAPILRALGMTHRQFVWSALAPAGVVAIIASAMGVVGAVALSPLLPLGEVGIYEPRPGIAIDGMVLLVGAIAIMVGVLVCVGVPAWRMARVSTGVLGAAEYGSSMRPSRVATSIAGLGLPVSAIAGTRLALEPGHGPSATPVRSAVLGLTLAITSMVAAFGFASSMDRFTSTPALWGVDWDFATGHPFIGPQFQNEAIPIIAHDPSVSDVTVGNFQEQLRLVGPGGEAQVAVWGTENLKGDPVDLTMLEGTWPRRDDEIALGAQTARVLGVGIDGTVRAELAGNHRELRVVGIPVFPDFGFGPGLGQGAGTSMDIVRAFYPDATLNLVAARFAPGADQQVAVDRMNAQLADVNPDILITPIDTESLGDSLTHTRRSRLLPLAMALLLAMIAFATLVHVLVTSVRRRRRDLAILRTIGFRRRQIATTIAWQATTITAISSLVGVPLGFLVGRLGWSMFADQLGVVSEPAGAWSSALVVVPTVLVIANLVAIGPAMFARRTQPAQVLRSE